MEAHLKIEEASYFLEKLKDMIKNTANLESIKKEISNEFFYNFSAFLSALQSAFYVLLYDYGEKYLGINRKEILHMDKFEKLAFKCKNQEATEFVRWYREKQEILKDDPLLSMRHYNVHRGYKELILEFRCLPLKHHGSLTVKVKPREKRGDVSNIGAVDNQIARFAYKEENEEIILMCEKSLEKMKSILEDASERFKI